jgi:hypothetical protein
MSSLTAKDRVSLCLFTFTDGRRCRTPRTVNHPHFCFYHAQKEARSQAAEKLAEDLAYFFSGDYLSACDLSTALSRLIPAVIRGDIKPRLARTVAYMIQSLIQTIHLSQDEYINAFSTDGWREAVRDSVNANGDYLYPPAPKPKPSAPPSTPQTPAQPPVPVPASPHAAVPVPTSSTVAARLQPATTTAPATPTTASPNAQRPRSQQSATSTPQPPRAGRPSPATVEEALSVARALFPPRPNSPAS